jgi:hypothetical protein
VRRIQESEVKDALKMMKGGKAMGPDRISIEVWSLGDVAIVWLTKLFNLIFRSNKMSDEWRRSILVPIFKNKMPSEQPAELPHTNGRKNLSPP